MCEFKMPNAAEWLDLLKAERGLETDAECAAFLKVSKQAVSHWRKGKHQIGVADCMQIGLATGVNPLFVIMCSHFHAAKEDKKGKWRLLAAPIEPKTPRKPGKKRIN